MKSQVEDLYKNSVRAKLKEELGLDNIMQVPKVLKVVLNMGVKDAVGDSKVLNNIVDLMTTIAGQRVVKTRAKKSIAGFKLREGMPIGVSVTLRGKRMYSFLDKLINIAIPRIKDFHGLRPKFDGNGNYNLGLRDWMVFPEIDYDKVDRSRGLNVTIQTSAKSDEHVFALLKALNMPFKDK